MTPFVDFGQVLCWPDVNRLRRVIVRLFGWGFRADRPPNGQLSAAPLAGVWSVEDRSKRQLLGNARAADR